MKSNIKLLSKKLDKIKGEKASTDKLILEQIKNLEAELKYQTHHTRLTGKIIESVWVAESTDRFNQQIYYAFCLNDGTIALPQSFHWEGSVKRPFIGKVISSSYNRNTTRWIIKTESGGKLSICHYSGYYSPERPIKLIFSDKLDARRRWKPL